MLAPPSSPVRQLVGSSPHLLYAHSLHVPAEVVPATHMKPQRAARPGAPGGSGAPRAGGEGAYRAPRGPPGGDDGYRRKTDDKKETAGGDFRPRFSGVGRGAGAAPSSQ